MLFGIGGLSALFFMETGIWFLAADNDSVAAVYALFVSSVAALLLWAFIVNILSSLNLVLFGFVMFGGLHIIFRGVPDID
jgi:hypothetical protein